jgi:uncharacterized protein
MEACGGHTVQINVATLLQEHVGSSRSLELVDEPVVVPEFDYRRTVSGRVRLIRTERGVLVTASLRTVAPLECARCLEGFEEEIELVFDEEYVLSAPHPVTGELPERDEGEFTIDDHWHLDLSEAVRQYEQSASPLIPLCRPDCPGFAVATTAASGATASEAEMVDDRWSALSGLAARLHEEDSNGAPEA